MLGTAKPNRGRGESKNASFLQKVWDNKGDKQIFQQQNISSAALLSSLIKTKSEWHIRKNIQSVVECWKWGLDGVYTMALALHSIAVLHHSEEA